MTVSIDDIAKQMLVLLPDDGTPVLNRVMHVMLSRKLATTVTQDQFFAARDLLYKQGRIGRMRGQGGQVFLLKDLPPEESLAPLAPELWPEAKLMPKLQIYLEGLFTKSLELPSDGTAIVQDTSKMGPARGRWARPDFILISVRRFKFALSPQLDVHSFELKSELGVDDLAVYEALAQTRFTHFGHLIWHLPQNSRSENRLSEIEQQCKQNGIGLVRIYNPNDPDSFETLLDPIRKNTHHATIDDFLELRLSNAQSEEVQRAIRGGRK